MGLISKKLFCTQNLVHKDWIHKNVVIYGKNERAYNVDLHSSEQMFHNEIGMFFEYMVNQNLKAYYITCSPKHDIVYDKECVDFFKNLNYFKNILRLPKNVVIPQSVQKLRELQSNDLMYFYENLILESFFIISKIKNERYYYHMVIFVKQDFDVNDFLKINFNIINVESIKHIFFEDITYNYMQKIFNFTELSNYGFYDLTFIDRDHKNIIYNPVFEQTHEYKNLIKYEEEQKKLGIFDYQQTDINYWHYNNEYVGIKSEITDQKLMFKHYFSEFGWHWFLLNYNFKDKYSLLEQAEQTYTNDAYFYVTIDEESSYLSKVQEDGKNMEYDQWYTVSCMYDLIDEFRMGVEIEKNYFFSSHVISVPKIKYNTSYKCRLKK